MISQKQITLKCLKSIICEVSANNYELTNYEFMSILKVYVKEKRNLPEIINFS